MKPSPIQKVLQHFVKFVGVFAVVFAASVVTTQAQAVFSPPVQVSQGIDSPGEPQVAIDRTGNINIVWSGETTPCTSMSCTVSIFFSRSTDGAATFSTPLNISNDTATSTFPQVGVDPSGNIDVIWNDKSPGYSAVFFSRSVDGGHTFSTPTNISAPSGGLLNQMRPEIVVDSRGNINVAWADFNNGGQIMFARSSDGGANFSAPVSLGTGASVGPSVVVDSTGGINIGWLGAVSGHNPFDLFFARSVDGGATFSSPRDISNLASGAAFEQIAEAPDGSIDVVWNSDCENSGFFTCPAGPSSDVFFSQSKDGGATFSAPVNLTNGAMAGIPIVKMAIDPTGNIDLAWSGGTTGGTYGFFSRSVDGGASFSVPRQAANGYAYPAAVDTTGNISIGSGAGNNLYVERSTDGGVTFSSTNVSNNDSNSTLQLTDARMATDTLGNVAVVWPNYNSITFKWTVLFSRGTVLSLSSLGLSAAGMTGGGSSTGTVTMSGPAPTGGAVISLSSSDASVSVPASVTIPEGTTSTTFAVTTSPMASATTAVISAAFNGVMQTASITVEPPVLASLTLNPSSVPGGASASTGTVTLSGPAPAGGVVVALSSSNTSVASVPSSVAVPPGFTNATFTVNTSPALCSNSATITASFSAASQRASIAVIPFMTLPSQACSTVGRHRHWKAQ